MSQAGTTRINMVSADSLTGMISSKSFSGLSASIQGIAIENVRAVKELESGLIGKLLGTRLPNMAIYGSFVLSVFFVLLILLCVCALIWCGLSYEFVLEVMKLTIPVITMSLGYMFGKKDSPE